MVFGKLGIFLGRARHVYIVSVGVGPVAFSGSRKWGDSMAMHQAQPRRSSSAPSICGVPTTHYLLAGTEQTYAVNSACANHSGSSFVSNLHT